MNDGNLQTGDSTIIVHTANDISITVETVDTNTDSTITLVTDTHTPNIIESEVALSDGHTQYSNTSTTQLNFQEDTISKDSTEDSPFAFTTTQLSSLVDPKNISHLKNLGGINGIVKGLHTDLHAGISNDEIATLEPITLGEISGKKLPDAKKHTSSTTLTTPFTQRISAFGVNVLPTRKPKSIFALMWIAMQDKILILLAIAAVVSLGLGLYEDFGVKSTPDGVQHPKVSWVEGVAIIVAIFIVIMVGSVNDWQKEKQFQKLNAKKEDRDIKVIRNGKEQLLSVHKILVGDLLQLEPGDIIAVDGVLVSSHNLKCDESAATGESDAIRKLKYEDCIDSDVKADPFIISGSKVLEGVGTYIVTAVGVNSYHGRTMMSLRTEPEDTPLQEKLNDLAEKIAKLGGIAALLMFVVLLIKYFVAFKDGVPEAKTAVESLTRIVISTVTVVVVAVPEGLPLAVTLALAFATTRMLKDNNLVRVLSACETMGNATTVCSDKTGTLTQNKMTVVAGTISQSVSFVKDPVAHSQSLKNRSSTLSIKQLENPMAITDLTRTLPKNVTHILEESIAVNSTAFEGETNSDGKITFVGSKTETALLELLIELGLKDYKKLREDAQIVQLFPFNSDRKAMGVVVKVSSTKWRFYVKGASEILVSKSRCIIDIESNTANPSSLSPHAKDLTQESLDMLKNMITYYASQSLRTVAVCYRDFEEWPPANMDTSDEEDKVTFEDLFNDVTLIGIVGIEDPLREGVREAVLNCKKAGVYVRMVTGDNILTAKSIATQCGIYTGGKIMEGPEFRNLPSAERDAIIPNLQVLARSSPEDKRILVSRLKELGEIVAVTGDGTNDGPALKTADVGFSMGIAGTEVAKEASAIILMDDNFSSIVKAIMWGRSVNDAVKKFLQFQLTVNVTAVLLTFISAVSSDDEKSVLKAVQLLWVNLIMDTFAALALATDPPTPELLDRKPEPRTAPLISFDMWKMIIGQSIIQLAVTLTLLYGGESLLNYGGDQLQTLIFNTFVFFQIFNEINCRRLDNKLNIFKGILANQFFVFIFVLMVLGQAMIVNFGGAAFQVVSLNGEQWGISLGLGFISIPAGVIIRLIPNAPLQRLMSCLKIPGMKTGMMGSTLAKRSDTFGLGKDEWNPAIANVRQKLFVFKTIRGGRLRASRLHIGHDKERAAKRSDAFAAATMVPSLVATSVGAGWSPNGTNRSSRQNSNIQLDVGRTLSQIQRMSTSSSTIAESIEMQRK